MCGATKIIGVDLNPNKEEVGKSKLFFLCITRSEEESLHFLTTEETSTFCRKRVRCD